MKLEATKLIEDIQPNFEGFKQQGAHLLRMTKRVMLPCLLSWISSSRIWRPNSSAVFGVTSAAVALCPRLLLKMSYCVNTYDYGKVRDAKPESQIICDFRTKCRMKKVLLEVNSI